LFNTPLDSSTNITESSMRPVVVGRKNSIHVGSKQAGWKVAAILVVMKAAATRSFSPRIPGGYSAGVARRPVRQVSQITPAAWSLLRVLAGAGAVSDFTDAEFCGRYFLSPLRNEFRYERLIKVKVT
jgi:hypothetical protein